jgi:hypothetical protein
MNKFYLKPWIAAALGLVLGLAVLPATSLALTYNELVTANQPSGGSHIPGKVLGDSTIAFDLNGDGIVNSLDFAICKSYIGQNYPPADFDKDGGVVDSEDCSMLTAWWFATR